MISSATGEEEARRKGQRRRCCDTTNACPRLGIPSPFSSTNKQGHGSATFGPAGNGKLDHKDEIFEKSHIQPTEIAIPPSSFYLGRLRHPLTSLHRPCPHVQQKDAPGRPTPARFMAFVGVNVVLVRREAAVIGLSLLSVGLQTKTSCGTALVFRARYPWAEFAEEC